MTDTDPPTRDMNAALRALAGVQSTVPGSPNTAGGIGSSGVGGMSAGSLAPDSTADPTPPREPEPDDSVEVSRALRALAGRAAEPVAEPAPSGEIAGWSDDDFDRARRVAEIRAEETRLANSTGRGSRRSVWERHPY